MTTDIPMTAVQTLARIHTWDAMEAILKQEHDTQPKNDLILLSSFGPVVRRQGSWHDSRSVEARSEDPSHNELLTL